MAAICRLSQELPNLSSPAANTWTEVVAEWDFIKLDRLEDGDYSICQLCASRIRELCYIKNHVTEAELVVGSHCFKEIKEDDPAYIKFGDIPNIFNGANNLLKDSLASANTALVEFAVRNKSFYRLNANRYYDISKKIKLSPPQKKYKMRINRALLYKNLFSHRTAYRRLKKSDRQVSKAKVYESTVGPKLIEYAFAMGAISEKDKVFYKGIWNLDNASLTQQQKIDKFELHNRIIKVFQNEFGSEDKIKAFF